MKLYFFISKKKVSQVLRLHFQLFLLAMYLPLITDICLGYLIRVREGRMLGKRGFRHNISVCVVGGGGGGRIRGKKTKTALVALTD